MTFLQWCLLVVVLFQGCLCLPPPIPSEFEQVNSSSNPLPFHRVLRAALQLQSKYVDHLGEIYNYLVAGPVIKVDATPKVSVYALQVAATTIASMSMLMPDIIFHALATHAKIGLFTANETIAVYPEYYAYINPPTCGDSCNGSCRASCTFDGRKYYTLPGASGERTAVLDDVISCNSQNPYHGTFNVLVHEFAHAVHYHGMSLSQKHKVTMAYTHAIQNNLWTDAYAMANEEEYFAVGASTFFASDKMYHAEHNGVGTFINRITGLGRKYPAYRKSR